jgi:hypothetical protein
MANDSSTGIPPIPPRYVGLANAETFGRLSSRPDRIDQTATAFFAEWIAGFPAALEIGSGNEQTGSINTVLGAPLVVKVTDSAGTAVAGVPVLFQVRELDARIDGRIAVTALTGQDGRATATRWRLGRTVGTQHVDVSAEGARTTFAADATAPGYSGSTTRPQSAPKSSGSRTS